MQPIPIESVRKWQTIQGMESPASISAVCPNCGEKGNFTLAEHNFDSVRSVVAATARCPGCNSRVHFWHIRSGRDTKDKKGRAGAVYMYPPTQNHYRIPTFASNVPDPLQKALVSTIEALNAKNYVATAVCGRRTLEGIFKFLVSEDQRKANLARLIEIAKKDIDLAAPLTALSHAIREGGNLGAHFDIENEPNELLLVRSWNC